MSDPALLAQVLRLSPIERIELIGEIWDTIPNTAEDLPLSDELKAELDRRLDEHHRNPAAGSPWEDAKARILNSR